MTLPAPVSEAVARGWSVIPVRIDKRPACAWKAYQTKCATSEELARFHAPLWAVVTGKVSGIVVLDFDGQQGRETLQKLGLKPHVRTGSGGFHVYATHPNWPIQTLNSKAQREIAKNFPGMDVRADGGYAAFCGRNQSGEYTWLREPTPDPFEELPAALRLSRWLRPNPGPKPEAGLRHGAATAVRNRVSSERLVRKALDEAANLGRNNAGFGLACQLRDNHYSEGEAQSALLDFALRVPAINTKGQREAYGRNEALASVREAYSAPAREPWKQRPEGQHTNDNPANSPDSEPDLTGFPHTDVGNAERLQALHGRDLCWIHERKGFAIFNGSRWTPDTSGQAKSLAVDTVRATYRQAGFIGEKDKREALEAHARRSERRAAIDGLLALFPAVGTTHSILDFDTQPYLLNCQNGTLDLETGRIYKPRRADLLSCVTPVAYESGAYCPVFLRFLIRMMGGLAGAPPGQARVAGERALFLQKAVGLSLSADVSEKVIFGLFGPKDSGKTTFLEAIRFCLGDYAGQVLIETLLSKSNQGDANTKEDLADLFGKRFVTTSEAERRHRLAGARLKYLTQGTHTTLKSVRKYEHTFTFPAMHKLWIDSNERPSLNGTDDALWERFKPAAFAYPVSADERDPDLPDKLRAEAAGILAWAVQGFQRWRKEGLGDPPDVVAARRDWRDECDPLKDFLEDSCRVDPADPELWATNSSLWKAYEAWAKDNGERWPLSRTAFGLQLERRGIQQEVRRIEGKPTRVRLHVEVL